jgi:membrane peptidoglycan carboxypeptidase
MNLSNTKFPDCDGHPDALMTGTWFVSGGGGLIDLATATAQSVNTYFAQLILEVGPCAAAKMADAAGVKLANGLESLAFGDPAKAAQLQAEAEAAQAAGDEATYLEKVFEADQISGFQNKPAVTLGPAAVTPLSMAGAYATFAARGKACTPSIVKYINDRDGALVKNYNLGVDNCREAGEEAGQSGITAEVADGVNDVLKGVVTNGLGSEVAFADGRDQGAMPGTTEYNDNVWTVTYTPEIAVSVNISADSDPRWTSFWDANEDGRVAEYEKTLLYRTLPSGRTLQGWSWLDPAVVVNAALGPLIGQLPATPFTPPG